MAGQELDRLEEAVEGEVVDEDGRPLGYSEFGRGIVICLAKFSEHLSYQTMDRYAVRQDFDPSSAFGSLSMAIEMWMNAGSDHFYDLDEKAGPKLKELAGLTLMIGHGFSSKQQTWTWETVEKIRRLWQESCEELDRQLGVENPNWGEW